MKNAEKLKQTVNQRFMTNIPLDELKKRENFVREKEIANRMKRDNVVVANNDDSFVLTDLKDPQVKEQNGEDFHSLQKNLENFLSKKEE